MPGTIAGHILCDRKEPLDSAGNGHDEDYLK